MAVQFIWNQCQWKCDVCIHYDVSLYLCIGIYNQHVLNIVLKFECWKTINLQVKWAYWDEYGTGYNLLGTGYNLLRK